MNQVQFPLLTYAPRWQAAQSDPVTSNDIGAYSLLIVPGGQTQVSDQLREWLPEHSVRLLTSENAADLREFATMRKITRIIFVCVTPWRDGVDEAGIISFLRLIKAMARFARLRLDVVTVNSIDSPVTDVVTHPVDAIYIGLAQTIAQEFSHWDVTALSLAGFTQANLLCGLAVNPRRGSCTPTLLASGQAWTVELESAACQAASATPGFRNGGRYLILGGAGGIGAALARHLVGKFRARIVLTGRRPAPEALLEDLRAMGGIATYERVDVADVEAMRALISRHPSLDGVVHSALVLDDASLLTMTEDQLLRVLRPKVHGSLALLEALRGRILDFVLLFSSIQSHIANPGQANYTAACVAKDAFGALMREAMTFNVKTINWGYWGSVGVVSSPAYRQRMQRLEIGSIDPVEGMAMIERLLASDEHQITVVKASDNALRRLGLEPPASPTWLGEADRSLQSTPDANSASLLDVIVPAFDPKMPSVKANIEAADALQDFARARLAAVSLPNQVVPRHARLAAALRAIGPGRQSDRDAFLAQFPHMQGHVRLLQVCLDHLPDILAGKTDPLSVMFPEGSFALVEPIYRDNPLADYFNAKVADIVAEFASRHGTRTLRVLEIGAGTGSTAQFVLPALAGYAATYDFTDLSFAFLNKARRRFGQYSFVNYKIFNVEQPDNTGTYDVVIATNVIHATRDLPAVLGNVGALLAPSGIFVLNEITSSQDFATMTFGLTDGWWLSQDSHRIANSPLVTARTWASLLLQAGFAAVRGHGADDQQIIVAAAPPQATPCVVGEAASAAPAHAIEKPAPDVSHGWAAAGAMPPARDAKFAARVRSYVRSVIAEVLQADEAEIEADQPFNEYGVDSLIALELLKPFRAALGEMPATVLFEHPTVARLATHFIESFPDAMERISQAPTGATKFVAAEVVTSEAAATATPPREAVSRPFAASYPDALAAIRGALVETLLVDAGEIDDTTPFVDLGVDSLIALELLKPLRARFGDLPATLLFEHPTVGRLAAHLDGQTRPGPVMESPGLAMPHAAAPIPGRGVMPGDRPRADDIVVIGLAAQFPDAADLQAFWDNLIEGRESVGPIPRERWPMQGAVNPHGFPAERCYTGLGAFIADVDAFDAPFFNITPLDAQRMDPQERLFLQNAFHAIADAGYTRADMRGSACGVFVGVMNGAYAWHRPTNADDPQPTSLFWSIANRTSYLFDLKGPSMAVDTACSSSLTALHLACQALRTGDCDMALAGGVNLIVHPRQYELLCGMHMLSRTGHCRPFGEGADGFVDGEGIACVALKRHSDALRDGDRIYGVIRGTAINAGGQSNGYSAPNPDAQARVITKALERAGVAPGSISYVEAHGTGTELGDPIEIRGLSTAFAGVAVGSVALGSVKGNIGHLESAAGLAGLVKILLQFQNAMLVPSINAAVENAHLMLAASPFRLQRTSAPWCVGVPTFAALSSFGAGGANAHAVVQSAPHPTRAEATEAVRVAALSARTKAGLQRQIDALAQWLSRHDPDPDALAYTLCCAREHFAMRAGYVFTSCDTLRAALKFDLADLLRKHPHAPGMEFKPARTSLGREDAEAMIAQFMAGGMVDWRDCFPRRAIVSLPSYPFEKQRFWVDSSSACFADPNAITQQHVIMGTAIAPAAWALSYLLQTEQVRSLQSVLWRGVITDLTDVVTYTDGTRRSLRSSDGVTTYVEASLGTDPTSAAPMTPRTDQRATRLERADIYRRFAAKGYAYGPDLCAIAWAVVTDSSVRAFIDPSRDWGFGISPALLDGGLQTAILLPALQRLTGEDDAFVPFHLEKLDVFRNPVNEAVFCTCTLDRVESDGRLVTLDLFFTDAHGETLIALRGLTSMSAKRAALQATQVLTAPARERARVLAYDLD